MREPTHPRSTLAARLIVAYAATVVAVLGVLAVVLDRQLEARLLSDLTESLVDRARAISAAIPDEGLQPVVRSLGEQTGVRITVIATDGLVLAESSADPSALENHLDRPEVRDALRQRVGVATRESESVGMPFRYVALPPEAGRIVRVALPLSIVKAELGHLRAVIVGGASIAAVLGIGAVWVIARRLTRPLRSMTTGVVEMSGGNLGRRIEPGGPADLAALAEAVNSLAAELEGRIAEIRADRGRLDEILSALDEGVVLVDPRGAVAYANPSARTMLDITEGDVVAPEGLRRVVEEGRAGARSAEIERGTPPRTLQSTAMPLAGDVLLVVRDVTPARRVEAMRRDFVADASHELKTPAAAIGAAAETVLRAIDDDPAAARRFAQQLARDADRLSRIVSDLLDLSRLESEGPRRERVRLDVIVREEAARADIEGDGRVRLEVTTIPITVEGSPKDLALLVRNLLENAVRYTPDGGSVRVDVFGTDGAADVVVADTGLGIPGRDLPRVFERFYRVDRARSRATGGTGLGLAIAKHVAEQHGGTITVESELGRGSTFRFSVPRASAG